LRYAYLVDIIRGLIERDGDEEVDVEMEMGAGSGVGVGERIKKQQQLLSAYTGVLRGLIDRRDIMQVGLVLYIHLGNLEARGKGRQRW
jgi:hypothetical protein